MSESNLAAGTGIIAVLLMLCLVWNSSFAEEPLGDAVSIAVHSQG
jgi:hypothetical protein